ncbi:FHDC1 [Cordylochernes scorpioides]|uniref:FHDC1 n=1 Tax=Cordylochernes scorpioides TaxID=51811 RepID=A0ABY6L2N0_9ARAC|nr:FHDC1 [Cordylochernes scorpioides]
MLNKAFPKDAPKRTTVFEWHSRFKAGRISIEDDPRQGRPKFQRTDENVQKITDLIKENPRTTLLELEQDTGISKTTIGRIVTEDLKLKKTPAKFIPRFLTNEQKLCRLATCKDMMEMTRTDPEWKDKIITGDETWVYGYDPETKPQSTEWRDIAPNDFFLFPKLKAVLKGRHFDTRDDIIEKSPLALKSIPKEAYKNCFDNWEKRWRWNKEKQPPIAFIAEQREEYDKRSSVTFIVDSGSTCHMINEEKLLDHQKKCDVNINVAKKEEVSSIVNNGGEVNFKGDKVTILKDGKKVLEGDQLENGLYAVNIEQHFSKQNDSNLTLPSENKTQEWHRKLGHIGMQNLRKLESLVDGMELNKLEKQENDVCEICIMAKQTRKSFGNERSRATRPLEIVHTDLCGPIEPLTHDNKKYIMTFLDDYTHFCYVYLLSNKYEAKEYIKEYVNEVERFLNAKVSKLRCDNGGEYANTQVKEWCKMKGIILDFTVPYTPQLNGKAERLNRTLIEKTRALLLDSKLNKEMWGEATRVAAYLINRSPSNTVQTTPAQMWFGRKPNLSNVKLFGSEVYVKKLGNLKKLDSKSEKYSLIGYSGNGYRLWDMQKRRIIIARDVVFTGKLTNEMTSVIQPRYREDLDSEIEESQDTKMELDSPDKPQNSTNSKYMLRNRGNINRPKRLKDYEVLNSVPEEIGLLTYNEAVTGVDKENWLEATENPVKNGKVHEAANHVENGSRHFLSDPPYLMELKVEGNFIKFEMDTGSGLTLISEKDFKNSLQHLKLEKASIIVRTYDGTVVPILGKINVKVECQDITYKLRALVVKGEKRALMGREWINRLKLGCFAVKHMPVEITIEEILKENQALFVETTEPIKGFTFSVNMCDVNPIFHKARPVPFAIKPAVTEALDKMVAKGYLCEVASSKWATPVVVVPKKNKEIRICCDFKVTLNKYLDTAAYPLPTQQDLFSTLAKGKYFSKLDLRNAYLQLEVDPGTRY